MLSHPFTGGFRKEPFDVSVTGGASAAGSTRGRDLTDSVQFAVVDGVADFVFFDPQTMTDRPSGCGVGRGEGIGQTIQHGW